MANQEHVEILLQGLKAWDEWRIEHPDIRPDLSRAIFTSADIEGTPLSESTFGAFLPSTNFVQLQAPGLYLPSAYLLGANFSQADLHNACLNRSNLECASFQQANLADTLLLLVNLTKANLSGANLSGADLSGANLSGADLSGANLSGADLSGATLNSTHLAGVNLEHAVIGWTTFANVDLSMVQGLETVKHEGPSTLGIDTFLRSGSHLPLNFLTQLGIPEKSLPSLRQQAQYYAALPVCSVGYTVEDQAFAQRLQSSFQERDTPCWPVALDTPAGIPVPTVTISYIEQYTKLVLVLSEAALKSERDMAYEVGRALEIEAKSQRQVLFPVYLDMSVWTASVAWLGPIQEGRESIDFARWREEDSYQHAFEQLVHVLTT